MLNQNNTDSGSPHRFSQNQKGSSAIIAHRRIAALFKPVGKGAAVIPLLKPRAKATLAPRSGSGFPHSVEHVSKLGVFRRAVRVDDIPECRCRRWRRLGVEAGNVETGEIGGDVNQAA